MSSVETCQINCFKLVEMLIKSLSSFISVAYLNLGTSLIALGRCHEAASVLRDGTKLDGTGLRDRTAHENARISSLLQLGGLYADQGKLQRALAVYREALHTLPHNYPPQVRRLKIHRQAICSTCGRRITAPRLAHADFCVTAN